MNVQAKVRIKRLKNSITEELQKTGNVVLESWIKDLKRLQTTISTEGLQKRKCPHCGEHL